MPLLPPPPTPPAAWFGPATISQSLPTSGNPFDPETNDVRAVFTRGKLRFERLAYFAAGRWNATLAAPQGGTYSARFILGGRPIGSPAKVTLQPSAKTTFVRREGIRFRLSDGKPFIPFGMNFAWQNGGDPSYAEGFARMAAAGLNWSRVWANSWDDKNPFIPRENARKLPLGALDEVALDRWDDVVRAAESNGIRIQFVLFHHGIFSSTTDSNWPDHPWNAKNGGFLKTPQDFFTDPLALKLTRAWLRYAVARWGNSPSIMAWELFNEVQWTDAAKNAATLPTVAAWHREMAAYLRSLDPVGRMVTSSSGEALDPSVFAAMDFSQPHTYPASVFGSIIGAEKPKDRPLFFGEFGGSGNRDAGANENLTVRDGFWAGLLGGQAGPGQYWNWDRVFARPDLMREFERLSKILARSGYAENPTAEPAAVTVVSSRPTDLTILPGRGWAKTSKFVYNLPADAATGALPELSEYIQGAKGANREMMKEPIRLRFNAPKPGKMTIRIGEASKMGGGLTVSVNGDDLFTAVYAPDQANRPVGNDAIVPFPAGPVEVTFDNPGADWVTVNSIRIPGLGNGVIAAALASDRYALVRLKWAAIDPDLSTSLKVAGLSDGEYEMRRWNLEDGSETVAAVTIQGGRIAAYRPTSQDEAFALFRR